MLTWIVIVADLIITSWQKQEHETDLLSLVYVIMFLIIVCE